MNQQKENSVEQQKETTTELDDLREEVGMWRARFGADVAAVGDPDPRRVRDLERALRSARIELAAARRAAQAWRLRAEEAAR